MKKDVFCKNILMIFNRIISDKPTFSGILGLHKKTLNLLISCCYVVTYFVRKNFTMPAVTPTILVSSQCPAELDVTTVLVPVWGAEKSANKDADAPASLPVSTALTCLADAMGLPVYDIAKEEKFTGTLAKTLVLRLPPSDKHTIKRVVLLGLGEAKKLTLGKLTMAIASGLKVIQAWDDTLQKVGISLPKPYEKWGGALNTVEVSKTTVSVEDITLAVTRGVFAVTYKALEAKKPAKPFANVVYLSPAETVSAVEQTLPLAIALNEGRSLTKDLVNMPANIKTTQTLVDAAKAIAAEFEHVSATIVEDVAWIQTEMPCFYQVARGSVETDPPKWIHLVYKGSNPTRKVALVGKSVIFDTGGYQVKPGDYMVTMKGDMAGGASVLGTLKAIATVAPAHLELHVFLAATPNKIDSDAMIPDSIVNTTCGKTVEIRHTDAEGRLTLIDAVTKACEQKPEAIVTVATLTGAAMMAVGRTIALMSNCPHWGALVHAGAEAAGEPVQALTVTPEDFENIQSKAEGADLRNTNRAKNRGAQTAAAFVMEGAEEGVPVVHLDIAGADMTDDEKATAYSVGSLVHFLLALPAEK
jgi:leucyl aminopeptidase